MRVVVLVGVAPRGASQDHDEALVHADAFAPIAAILASMVPTALCVA